MAMFKSFTPFRQIAFLPDIHRIPQFMSKVMKKMKTFIQKNIPSGNSAQRDVFPFTSLRGDAFFFDLFVSSTTNTGF